jgi:hypothetical protein
VTKLCCCGGDGLRVDVWLPRLRFTWESNRANNWPKTRPRWDRSSLDTAFHQNTTHSSVALYFTQSLSQYLTHLETRYSHIASTIAAEHTFAVTADPTSSPTEASQSRAPSAQLTVIQTSYCVLLSKRGGFKELQKESRTLLLWKAPCKHGQGLDAQRTLLHSTSCITLPTFGGDNISFESFFFFFLFLYPCNGERDLCLAHFLSKLLLKPVNMYVSTRSSHRHYMVTIFHRPLVCMASQRPVTWTFAHSSFIRFSIRKATMSNDFRHRLE